MMPPEDVFMSRDDLRLVYGPHIEFVRSGRYEARYDRHFPSLDVNKAVEVAKNDITARIQRYVRDQGERGDIVLVRDRSDVLVDAGSIGFFRRKAWVTFNTTAVLDYFRRNDDPELSCVRDAPSSSPKSL